jgi:hypothetical protein
MPRAAIRREVNLINETLFSGDTDPIYYPAPSAALVKVDLDDYSGTCTAYLEVVANNIDSLNAYVRLYYDDNPGMSSPTEEASSLINVGALTIPWFRYRSAGFSLSATQTYWMLQLTATLNPGQLQVLAARIVIIQEGADTTDIYKTIAHFDVGFNFGIYTTDYSVQEQIQRQNPYYIQGDNYDQIVDGFASVVVQADSSKGTSGGSLVRLKYTTDFLTWFDGPTIFSGAIPGSSPPFAFFETTFASSWITAPGGSTRPVWWGCSLELTAKDGFGMALCKMGVRQDGGSTDTPITKTEDCYKMISQHISTPNTGPSKFFTYFDPSSNEWESIANEYYHVISGAISVLYEARIHLSSSGSTAAIAGTEVALTTDHGAVLESTFGSSMTMPSSAGELDCFISAIGVI